MTPQEQLRHALYWSADVYNHVNGTFWRQNIVEMTPEEAREIAAAVRDAYANAVIKVFARRGVHPQIESENVTVIAYS